MATAAEDLRTFVLTDATVAAAVTARMFENTVPSTSTTLPFIWYRLSGREWLGILGEAESKPYRERFDVECVADDLDDAHDLADAVRAKLDGHKGAMGTGSYQWVHVMDQYEDYQARNLEADEHLHVVAMAVEVINSGV